MLHSLNTSTFELVNIHLFHDDSNLEAIRVVSIYTRQASVSQLSCEQAIYQMANYPSFVILLSQMREWKEKIEVDHSGCKGLKGIAEKQRRRLITDLAANLTSPMITCGKCEFQQNIYLQYM